MSDQNTASEDESAIFFREWRTHRALNQEAAAEALGISRNYLSEVERGVKRWNQDLLEGMAIAYRCSVVDLLSVDPTKEKPRRTRFLTIFDSAKPEQQDLAISIVEGIVQHDKGKRA